MSLMTRERCLELMSQTPIILQAILHGVSDAQAHTVRDGAGGWSVVEILCHLRDFDGFYQERIAMMIAQDDPLLTSYDHEAIAIEHAYQFENLNDVVQQYRESRRRFIELISNLTDDQLERTGVHAEDGQITVIYQAFRSAAHDIDHTQQIARILGLAETF